MKIAPGGQVHVWDFESVNANFCVGLVLGGREVVSDAFHPNRASEAPLSPCPSNYITEPRHSPETRPHWTRGSTGCRQMFVRRHHSHQRSRWQTSACHRQTGINLGPHLFPFSISLSPVLTAIDTYTGPSKQATEGQSIQLSGSPSLLCGSWFELPCVTDVPGPHHKTRHKCSKLFFSLEMFIVFYRYKSTQYIRKTRPPINKQPWSVLAMFVVFFGGQQSGE